MPRSLLAALAALLLLPATAAAHDHKPVPVDGIDFAAAVAEEGAGTQPVLHMDPQIPSWLKGGVRAADHFGAAEVKQQQFQDEHGHILTLATDNPGVDLEPFAAMLAGIPYHGGEIEFLHAFVTSRTGIEQICGADAAACYGADAPGRSPGGAMVISYEDPDILHAVVHEYGHHIDTNTYNLDGIRGCDVSSDGSRRWFFAREMEDRILENLTCDPRADWGQLLPEVFAEDFAQLNGIPREEYHPAITVNPPSRRQLGALDADLTQPFGPDSQKVKGRGKRGVANFTLSSNIPVFIAFRQRKGVRSIKVRGCNYEGFKDVYAGKCRVKVKTKRPRGRFSFRVVIF
jgi:hypothetical protein